MAIDYNVETAPQSYTQVYVNQEPELIPMQGLRYNNGHLEELYLEVTYHGQIRELKLVWKRAPLTFRKSQ